ncbi:NADP-dependent 3-hydroxy acid dehydrogenase YdfG [Streptoalloteichus tenebrarius]|uniref:NADP-dependent 3-hydroxy acid dehydrogenase YdfG n=1 Tax=Streptoalloteichus tenebrarius (strain ATCC 17920 / DSM 40477 / JCM 4838 / CBS 697.72 / NBRC 16177 / NCIMB 11028 / NRRL B-12390 / A12253. 1 / ISP 5477) TaxID=1933 RepID=A0ABT1HTJ7_STRSD|nr:SDR family NAD(P)-dependent oxidoreductase [Streptoalloteichus tenebrarius]MCP2258835.1 NADP-dependent 3-hydroxy acid dehydrogenase YdfG [Streptoalloteichus tenebrarius]BFE99480.1 SDR family oxidoreductase [Streptoalloteichus tenebrarius]
MVQPTRPAQPRVWFVTGAGRGFGREFTRAALAVGDRVVATARRPHVMDDLVAEHGDDLVVLPLDVDDRAAVFAAVERAVAAFGRLDIVVNNAGYGLLGMVEEVTEAEVRAQMDTNFFGALWVTQAVLPHLRAQGSGHIVQISSLGAHLGFASTGLYGASKWALEGMSEALAHEVARFGIRVTLVEPGGYATEWGANLHMAAQSEAYAPLYAELAQMWGEVTDGDPAKVAEAVLTLVDSDEPPMRLLLGSLAYDTAMDVARRRVAEWERWEAVSRAAD